MIDPTTMFDFTYGLYVVSATGKEGSSGCVINTATQVTAAPIQVAVSVNKENVTCERMLEAGHFALTVLDNTVDMPFIGRFGFRSSRDIDKYEGIDVATSDLGDVYATDHACAMIAVRVSETLDMGTHLLFVGEVVQTEKLGDAAPLTYTEYHTTLKGKTPPKAASYVAN